MKFRNVRLLCHASLCFHHFILLEVTKILKRLGYFLVGEFVFKLIGIKVEFRNHFIDLLDMNLETLFGLLYAFIPKHRMESLDILLSNQYITSHFEIGTASLSSQNISLALHEGMLYPNVLLALNVSSEARLNFSGSIFTAEHTISSVPHLRDKSLYLGLDHHQTFALSSELLSHSISSPSSLDIDNKEFLCIGEDHICIPSLVGIYT